MNSTALGDNDSADPLSRPLADLRGVGPERTAQLERLGLRQVQDLLQYRPRRYEDRRNVRTIAELRLHETGTVRGQIVAMGVKRFAQGRKSMFEIVVDDGTARLHCRWWNLPYMQNYFKQGDEVLVYGKLLELKPRTIDHPETETIDHEESDRSVHLQRVVPIYPLTDGLPQRWLRSFVWKTLGEFSPFVSELGTAGEVENLPNLREAISSLHFPNEPDEGERARGRLALEELVRLQVNLQKRRQMLQNARQAEACPGTNKLIKPFLAQLGFRLTDAQTKVLRELRHDMSSAAPMRRLLQGDVGSGKTAVAACCALFAIESGCNAVLMAPTELLAEQHFQTFSRWFNPLGVRVHNYTGTRKTLPASTLDPLPPGPRTAAPGAHESGSTQSEERALIIGTHALIEKSFAIDQLGLVIIDEQHRFGVAQRERLVRKGRHPHLLLMTATPIPRSLGLTIYGDLDVSIINELPPGRTPIKTFVRTRESLAKVWAFLRDQLEKGRQGYVVLPRVEETSQGVKAVTKEHEVLQRELAPFKVGMLHGRLDAETRGRIMSEFAANRLHVLLSTSLIEVGIDVSNATILVVENAEQFGLAQLHQLRGRIGRGPGQSYCVLINQAKTDEARKRLAVMAETSDGFRIAEEDLNLRGPGNLLGSEQSGLPPFIFADLKTDLALVERARAIAAQILERGSP